MYEHRTERLLSPAEFAKRVVRPSLARAFCCRRWIGNRSAGISLSRRTELGGLAIECFDDFRWDGTCRYSPFHGSQDIRFVLCLIFRLAFIGVASLIVAPFAHRLLHRFHLDQK